MPAPNRLSFPGLLHCFTFFLRAFQPSPTSHSGGKEVGLSSLGSSGFPPAEIVPLCLYVCLAQIGGSGRAECVHHVTVERRSAERLQEPLLARGRWPAQRTTHDTGILGWESSLGQPKGFDPKSPIPTEQVRGGRPPFASIVIVVVVLRVHFALTLAGSGTTTSTWVRVQARRHALGGREVVVLTLVAAAVLLLLLLAAIVSAIALTLIVARCKIQRGNFNSTPRGRSSCRPIFVLGPSATGTC